MTEEEQLAAEFETHRSCLHAIAFRVLGSHADADDAAPLPVEERILGPEHPRTLANRRNLAELTVVAGDPATARDQFAEFLPVRRALFSPIRAAARVPLSNPPWDLEIRAELAS